MTKRTRIARAWRRRAGELEQSAARARELGRQELADQLERAAAGYRRDADKLTNSVKNT